jgi:hypothetical protein
MRYDAFKAAKDKGAAPIAAPAIAAPPGPPPGGPPISGLPGIRRSMRGRIGVQNMVISSGQGD